MKEERDYLVGVLKKAGIRSTVHDSLKSLKNCNETHVGAVLRVKETFARSGSKKIYGEEGQRKQRKKLHVRITTLHVVIADSNEEKVDAILTNFMKNIGKGVPVDRNWVEINVGDVDWIEEGDSILKSKIAVEFDVNKMTDKKDYMTIEELKAQKDTSNAVFAGVKTANGWGTGKMVTEQEYDAAVKAFNDAPMDGSVR